MIAHDQNFSMDDVITLAIFLPVMLGILAYLMYVMNWKQ